MYPAIKALAIIKKEAVSDEAVQNGLKLMYSVLLRICNLDPEEEKRKSRNAAPLYGSYVSCGEK